jgi:protein-disulfide isomerase
MDNKNQSSINLPSAIIIAGAIIAIAIIYVKKPVTNTIIPTDNQQVSNKINLEPVTAKDHILGNPNAPIKIVEYSDPSCPYCKTFNSTMNQIMDKYGPSGKVAWVYRSIPLDTPDANGNVLHPNARNESQAIECADILGGNEKFWAPLRRFMVLSDGTPTSARRQCLRSIVYLVTMCVWRWAVGVRGSRCQR